MTQRCSVAPGTQSWWDAKTLFSQQTLTCWIPTQPEGFARQGCLPLESILRKAFGILFYD